MPSNTTQNAINIAKAFQNTIRNIIAAALSFSPPTTPLQTSRTYPPSAKALKAPVGPGEEAWFPPLACSALGADSGPQVPLAEAAQKIGAEFLQGRVTGLHFHPPQPSP